MCSSNDKCALNPGPRSPKEITKLAEGADDSQRSYMYESWLLAEGSWKNSKLYLTLKKKGSHSRRGLRRWYTFDEMVTKFGAEAARDIKERKENDPKLCGTEIRAHPECPDNEARA